MTRNDRSSNYRVSTPLVAVFLGAIALLLPLTAPAEGTRTGDIRLEEGFVDPQSGARVDRVTTDPATGMQEIRLVVPHPAAGTESPIDEVIVTGHRPERQFTLPQLKPHEYVRDYDHDHYGVVIYLGRHENVPVRFYFDSRQADPHTTPP